MSGTLRLLYVLLVGGTVLAVVVTGTKALYPPKEYQQSCVQEVARSDAGLIEKAKNLISGRQDYNNCRQGRDAEEQKHKRNSAVIALGAAALCALAVLFIPKRQAVIAEGLSAGAIMTALYGVRLSSKTGSNVLVFVAALLLLAITLLSAYHKFATPKPLPPPKT